MRKSLSRFLAFALSLAVVVMASVGVLAYDDHLVSTVDGYGGVPISVVDGFQVDGYVYRSGVEYVSSHPGPGNWYGWGYSASWSGFSGIRITVPASSYDSLLTVSGVASFVWSKSSSVVGWSSSTPSSFSHRATYFLWSPSNPFFSLSTVSPDFEPFYQGTSIFVPASTAPTFVYIGFSFDTVSNSVYVGSYLSPGFSCTRSFLPSQSTLSQIFTTLQSIGSSLGELSPMEQFENNYLENFGDQISQAEHAISPSNPALPNGGDIGGFIGDVTSGLGLSGSSFSASDLNEAASGFSGSNATAPGGPWEFFTQGVSDSLSGDAPMSIDDDYDPILSWLEESERRFGAWSNP